jgi:predicted transcriptional regulator
MPVATPKQTARRIVDRLDDEASYEDIQYRLYVAAQVERGLRDVEAGHTVSHEEARQHLSKWLGDESAGE